jgi:hypothetical protein
MSSRVRSRRNFFRSLESHPLSAETLRRRRTRLERLPWRSSATRSGNGNSVAGRTPLGQPSRSVVSHMR